MALTTYLAYFLVACYFVIERALRKGDQALSLEPTRFDRGSQRLASLSGLVTIVSLLLAPWLNQHHVGQIVRDTQLIGWSGIGIAVIGLIIRYWAARTLGRFYTRTLRIVAEQSIVDWGIYRVIRHPGYLGVFLSSVGTALATMNGLTVIVIAAAGLITYSHRIHAEETMLKATFGESYRAYMRRTWRLVPFIF